MKGKRFTEEQIIRLLQEAESGLTVADVCRKHNCSEQSFYRWKAKFGGMTVSEAKRLRELVRENTELKTIVADQALDIRMLKDVNSRKW
jgi:putative transposase